MLANVSACNVGLVLFPRVEKGKYTSNPQEIFYMHQWPVAMTGNNVWPDLETFWA